MKFGLAIDYTHIYKLYMHEVLSVSRKYTMAMVLIFEVTSDKFNNLYISRMFFQQYNDNNETLYLY